MYITVDELPVVTFADSASGGGAARPSRARSALEKLWWGSAPEFCSECGIEVRPSQAIRYPGGRLYCSLEHAIEDQAG